jgi:beta-galactosidase
LHLLPHWNWAGQEGQEIDVRILSNCEEVELFLNNQSLGRQAMKQNSHLAWRVKYAPGTLMAKGYKSGHLVAQTSVQTTGAPAKIRLFADREYIDADGQDVSVITVSVTDDQGRLVPTASNLVHFSLEGPGAILGVGNGDPSCHEPDVYRPSSTINSRPVKNWDWEKLADVHTSQLAEVAPQFDDSHWIPIDPQGNVGSLAENENGIFRAQLVVTEEDLAASIMELCIGRIDDNGWIYVNGLKVGESHDWQQSPVFSIKEKLHPGTNSIAVVVENQSGPGGLSLGVSLQTQRLLAASPWQRSVFNGLAQIIVQSSKVAGKIKLAANADGLSSDSAIIQSRPCVLRPQLEAANFANQSNSNP